MGIYHNFDKLVKTHVNSVLQMSLLFSYCFLPYEYHFGQLHQHQPEHRSDYDYYDWESWRNKLLKPYEFFTRRQKAWISTVA